MEAISKDPFVPALKPDQRTTSIGEAAHRHENDNVGRVEARLEIGSY
uniref:Uncharacterized protein n=1 Tax=Brassica oleracea var. oleracea TaxID=109376 RepID=A0A0D3C3T4_BRAOL